METTASATRRGVAIGLVLAMVAVALWSIAEDRADAAAPGAVPAAALFYQGDDVLPSQLVGGWFAKYDGVDGESNDGTHNKWITILRYEWGVEKPQGSVGQSWRGAASVDDLVFEFEYEKAAPKLLEKCLKGEVIPQLEFELTTSVGEGFRVTYLKYEMKNVLCSMYEVGGWADGSPPNVVIANDFEEIKVTYTEYDDEGSLIGTVETEWKVEE